MSKPLYIIAGGGTGGHLYPGLAVAESLAALEPDAQVLFACSDRDIDRRILDPLAYGKIVQPVRPLPRRIRDVPGFLVTWRQSGVLAADIIRDLKPAAVLGTGGFAAGPMVKRAAKCGIRCGLLNPDAVPGKANRYLGKYSEAIFTQYAATAEYFPPTVRERVHAVGCPISRRFAQADRAEAIAMFGLDAGRKTLLVNGGSLGASSINEAIVALKDDLDELAGSWQVLHITGPTWMEGTDEPGLEIPIVELDYCDRMDMAYAAADLALCRCGASTAGELAGTGTPSLIMPYPYHADQHQRLNAESLAAAGKALVCEDARDLEANVSMLREQLLGLMRDGGRLAKMRETVQESAGGNAADEVASWLLETA